MHFHSHHITGKGRGKGIGFPTINLEIPKEFTLEDGVYAVLVSIDGKAFKGAMHYGPIPVFHELKKSLEIYLLEVNAEDFPEIDDTVIEVTVKKFIREIRSFPDTKALALQIEKDVAEINTILSV